MAIRTRLPKRTLDKYMLRSNANSPGFEALSSLSKGLGVSLDWLVFGKEFSSEGVELLTQMAATKTSLMDFETLLREHKEGKRPLVVGEEILGLTPQEWAADMGVRFGKAAKELAACRVTRQELQTWQAASQERVAELMSDRFNRMFAKKPTSE